jgi:hypothetical protein
MEEQEEHLLQKQDLHLLFLRDQVAGGEVEPPSLLESEEQEETEVVLEQAEEAEEQLKVLEMEATVEMGCQERF